MTDPTRPVSTALVVVPAPSRPPALVDVGIDAAASVARRALAVSRTGRRVGAPVARLMLRPPGVGPRHWPQTYLLAMAEHGRAIRERAEEQATVRFGVLVPAIVDAVLDRVDLTQLVINRVGIDRVVDNVDLVAIVNRLPIEQILDRLDFDAIIASVDIDAIVGRVDIDAIASRIDLDAIVERLDILAIAQEVIEGIDLPEIIRESSGAMASETVVGVRMRGIEADERISRIVDRVMLRRRARDAIVTQRGSDDDGDG